MDKVDEVLNNCLTGTSICGKTGDSGLQCFAEAFLECLGEDLFVDDFFLPGDGLIIGGSVEGG